MIDLAITMDDISCTNILKWSLGVDRCQPNHDNNNNKYKTGHADANKLEPDFRQ